MHFKNIFSNSKRMRKNSIHLLLPALIITLLISCGDNKKKNGEDLFDDSKVHTVKVTFSQAGFWDSLTMYRQIRDSQEITKYMKCDVSIDGEEVESSGIRFKGESSYDYTKTRKKSFKISFNKFDKKGKLEGIKRISLNNNFKDPTMMREKLMLDFYREQGLPAQRSAYAKLYINDVYWGLYLLVEEINDQFLTHNFGNDTGNLYMGEPNPTLKYLGESKNDYIRKYKQKNNRKKDSSWSDLLTLIETVNDTASAPAAYAANLDKHLDTDNMLKAWAINNLFVNVDAYNMLYPHNFYLYYNIPEGRFKWISYDFNYGFAAWNPKLSLQQVYELDIFYVKEPVRELPLAWHVLKRNEQYRSVYKAKMQELAEKHFTPELMSAKIDKLASLIRQDVYQDTMKMYTNEEFDHNLDRDLGDVLDPGAFVPGLKPFVKNRRDNVLGQLKSSGKEKL